MSRLPAIMACACAMTGGAGSVLACASIDQATVFFEFKSAELSAQARNGLGEAARWMRPRTNANVPVACKRAVVTGHTDAAEAATPEARLDLARAEAVRQNLEQLGVDVGAIRFEGGMGNLLVATGPGVREPQNRRVLLQWTLPEGRWRCDPATEQDVSTPACIGKYRACYYELADGTICNLDGVPDASPQRYSVYYP